MLVLRRKLSDSGLGYGNVLTYRLGNSRPLSNGLCSEKQSLNEEVSSSSYATAVDFVIKHKHHLSDAYLKHQIGDLEISNSNSYLKRADSSNTHYQSPPNSLYSGYGTQYTEAKESFETMGVSEKSCGSAKTHKGSDIRWEAIQAVRSSDGVLGLNHFRLLKRLGCGDIGSVYLSELSGAKSYYAMKVMDKTALTARKKLPKAQTEREILQSLDHPFLPTLYTHFEMDKFSCLVMEFYPGGDLHALGQKQPGKHFPEHVARYDL
ncbi:hypothetical protein GIB67_015683 [Kingdonia uniflora]|uniref:non-specific serine/threonine protein kinase n=1 Tax=Kingdonia uniflora TaxID=39325 RepID=A0A7J7NU76_9MAGN|nr:hypothetical protein GIB67_015683 [Kingdonia uniflora]